MTEPAKEPETVTADIVIPTTALVSGPHDDEVAKSRFLEFLSEKKVKVDPATVEITGKHHEVGHRLTYTFSAKAK